MPDEQPVLQRIKLDDARNKPRWLSAGSFATTDLGRFRRFYEDFLGLHCVQHKAGGLLVRDKLPGGYAAGANHWILEITEVDELTHPQHVFNHWGVDLVTKAEVEAAHKAATEQPEAYGFKKVMSIRDQHGVYSFYSSDFDDNWWEIQYRYGEKVTSVDGNEQKSVLNPIRFSHGTLEIREAEPTIIFYTEFLGLEIRKGPGAFWLLKNEEELYVACVGVGKKLHPQGPVNRWILDFAEKDQVDRIPDLAREHAAEFEIQTVEPVRDEDGRYYCRLQDLDGNWWDCQWDAGKYYDALFDNGNSA